MHLSISANMWDWARLLDHAHLRTQYVIWEWPGVVFVLFLWIVPWTSSLVRVSNGRSSLVFKGPVHWTEKMIETGLDVTKCNQTVSCGCPLLW